MKRFIGLLIFDEVDLFDVAGALEVFAAVPLAEPLVGYTIAELPATVRTRQGLKVIPDYTVENAPAPHWLGIPGGPGAAALRRRPLLLEWLRRKAIDAEVLWAVGTGVTVLAQAGLLAGREVAAPAEWHEEAGTADFRVQRVASAGYLYRRPIATAASTAAGLDLALYLVQRHLGSAAALAAAQRLGFPWDGETTQGRNSSRPPSAPS